VFVTIAIGYYWPVTLPMSKVLERDHDPNGRAMSHAFVDQTMEKSKEGEPPFAGFVGKFDSTDALATMKAALDGFDPAEAQS
jgi:hypothetical protein